VKQTITKWIMDKKTKFGFPKGKIAAHETKSSFLFTAPTIAFFLIFLIYPTLNAFIVSMHKYDIFQPKVFIGFRNYVNMLTSQVFLRSFGVTLLFVFGTAIPTTIISLAAAIVLNKAFIGRTFYRAVFFMPSVMSLVAVALIASGIFDPNGMVNSLVNIFRSSDKPLYWISTYPNALFALIIVRIWRTFGYYMILYLAGLQGIPKEYYEAATVDGVNVWQKFRHITWPLLAPTTAIVTIILVVNSFQAFAVPYVMTGGGPAQKTRIIPIMLYETAFRDFKMGQASAISVLMLLSVSVFAIFQFRMSKKLYGD
jgi:ABC-type sugar transport system permease subunit